MRRTSALGAALVAGVGLAAPKHLPLPAPSLLYLPKGGVDGKGIYYLATEVYPNRYDDAHRGDWQVKVFHAAAPLPK